MAQSFGGKARFVTENYGDSELARRFGVTRYPAIFVDDVLVAKPKDFGFYGKGEGGGEGRYTPFKNAESHERFRADLARMIELILAGRMDVARAQAVPAQDTDIASLPKLALTDLEGKPVTKESLAGRPVLVEFWATWCPPCRGTLAWLGDLQRKHGDRLVVLAIAVESDEADVRRMAGEIGAPIRWAMGSPEVARSFGDISAVPTLFLFDGQGRTAATFFGAPPGLHDEAEGKVAALLR
ncbi:MAG TPA: TlpA disulfide reductase family protein [Vicinamibacteria bacterium]